MNITNHSDNEINLNNTFENIVELNKLNENNLPKLIPRKENNQKILINMNKIKKNLNPLEIEERFNKYLSEYKKNNNIKKEILDCIKNIINKIKDIKSTGLENTFSGPYLIGSFHRFGIDSAIYEKNINIDILFTCSNLEKLNFNNYEIIKNLIKGILIGDLNLSEKDLSFNLNQKKNIIVYEIQLIEYSNIKICCYFIDIEQKKESNIVNNILLEQMKFIMLENKQILCFFLRKWRKKWNLNFIIPEILDQIVEDFYKKNMTLTFQNIMYNLYLKNIEIPFKIDSTNILYNDLIKEWFKNNNFSLIQNACLESEMLLSQDKFDEIFN